MAQIKRQNKHYIVILGRREVRFFRDFNFMCETMQLDPIVIRRYLNERGWWCGMNMTVYAAPLETHAKNFGKL